MRRFLCSLAPLLIPGVAGQNSFAEQLKARWTVTKNPLEMMYDDEAGIDSEKYGGKFAVMSQPGSAVNLENLVVGAYATCPGATANAPKLAGITFTQEADYIEFSPEHVFSIFKLNKEIMDNTEVFTRSTGEDGTMKGTGNFCFCIQLPNSDGDVVSFAQMQIEITYDLSTSFDVVTFNTEADPEVDQNVEPTLIEDPSGGQPMEAALPPEMQDKVFEPGDVPEFEVCPEDSRFAPTEVLFIRASNDAGLSQDLPKEQVNLEGDGSCAKVSFMMSANLYPDNGEGNVNIAGAIGLSFARRDRHLMSEEDGERLLQEDSASSGNFKLQLKVRSAGGGNGGNASSGCSWRVTTASLHHAIAVTATVAMAWAVCLL